MKKSNFINKTPETIKVVAFDDHKERLNALKLLIELEEGLQCIGTYENCSHLVENLSPDPPDVVLMDIAMPECNGIEGVLQLQKHFPQTLILMQTVFEDDDKIFQCIQAGAHGYVLKKTPPEELIAAIYELVNGGSPMTASIARRVLQLFKSQTSNSQFQSFDLSSREVEILSCLVKGLSQKMIADRLIISTFTVNNHLKKVYQKLHVHNASEAVAKALKNNIV